MDFSGKLLQKLAYKFVNKTKLDLDFYDLDVKMKDDVVEIDFNGYVTIPKEELIKLFFKDEN